MAVELSSNAQRWLARAPSLLNLVLVVLIGLLAARLFWLVWPAPESSLELVSGDTGSITTADNTSGSSNINTITSANLFGAPVLTAARQPEQNKIINAPETNLDLTLTGIVSNRAGGQSRALIENPEGEQGSYATGDTIISDVTLHDIYVNKVILERNGRYETLTLESVKKAKAVKRVSDGTVTGTLAQQLGRIRSKILSNPAAARRYIRLQPARQNGTLIGYRIYPGPERALFKKAGLQPGAIVTAINGQSLSNPATALRLLGKVANAPSVTFTLRHNGQQRTVTVRFE